MQYLPALAIDAQSISQAPGIDMVGFGACRRFAFAVARGGYRVHWVKSKLMLQELIDRSSLVGFYSDSQAREARHLLEKTLPAFQ